MDLSIPALRGVVDELASRADAGGPTVNRLRDSVARPLDDLAGRALDVPSEAPPDAGDTLWGLTTAVTALRAANPEIPELAEASAALQDLSLAGEPEPETAAARYALLESMQARLPAQLQVMRDGPYLLTNPVSLRDGLGRPLPIRPQLALCRCGGSQRKPFCDGAHARLGFTGGKDPGRVPDRRDGYTGQQIDILDNRGLCQHSGLCTDRLATVFHAGSGPFVTASGGRLDEIIRAVRDCPSGALSFAVDDVEARDQVDHHDRRPPGVEVTRDGPYRITGGIPLVDHDGADVIRNTGASREHYALCRCGRSQNKPFCSGMHYYVEFHDPVTDDEHQPTIFEWAGGLPALTRMTRLFYEKHVPQDALLAPLFATMSPDHPQRVAKWLAEVFGGPRRYSAEHGGYPRMLSQHRGKHLTEDQRARWVSLLLQSAREAGLPNDAEFRSAFGAYIEWGSRLAVENSQADATPPENMPMPGWNWTTAAGPPGSRVSALAPSVPDPVAAVQLPGPDEPISFATHVRPMFRPVDQRSMSFRFDLWSYDDVSAGADGILDRLRAGSMPCDGPWPPEQVAVFQRWIDSGKPR
ncbi:MAG TPA: CDGSH iron-sulfur domain-containing protein [Streptosporangiaceae bacterium]